MKNKKDKTLKGGTTVSIMFNVNLSSLGMTEMHVNCDLKDLAQTLDGIASDLNAHNVRRSALFAASQQELSDAN